MTDDFEVKTPDIINPLLTNAVICKVLGYDPHKVSRIVIELEGMKMPTITVHHFLSSKDSKELAAIIDRYNLVPKAVSTHELEERRKGKP
jgi:hypothetical protein